VQILRSLRSLRMTMAEEILIAADHAGFEMKEKLESELQRMGYKVKDLGTNSAESTDYADFAHPLAKDISKGGHKRGVLLCGTGLGMSYVANRYKNVRAAVTWSPQVAELARQHNDANVLVLPSRHLSDDEAVAILHKFLETPFEGGRHVRRVQKIETKSDKRTARKTVKRAVKKAVRKAARPKRRSR
jgi:ribose 5-phosphate isomerase B